jgi:4-hydroxy-tetrahydrodipicolinate reductase
MSLKVAQWATGNVGRAAVQTIVSHPELELVDLIVHSPDKVGRDAGELVGIPHVGVAATDDVDAVLARRPDCVSYTATGDLRPAAAVADICRVLEAGINVVSTSVVPLVHPKSADEGLVTQLEAACKAGGTSCFTSGIDPGFANDVLPLTLLGVADRVDSIRVMEILNYDTYDQPEVLFETMGFGKPMDHIPILLLPGVLGLAWGGTVNMLAEGLGVELDEVRETYERLPAPTTFTIPPGTVQEGTVAGLRFSVEGIVGGKPAIVLEHVTRLRDDIAPDWPHALSGKGSYRVIIDGNPNMRCELEIEGEDGDPNTGGLLVTATRIVNAIPAVCAAAPGLLTPLDLPLVTGRGRMPA